MAFQRILCPVDFSECSRRAMEIALELASSLGASVALLNVVEPRHEPFPPPAGLIPVDVPGDRLADALRHLEAWQAAARRHGDITVSALAVNGVPSDAILEAIQSGPGHDLVVMGSHGLGGFKRAILGSVADTVARHAPCPVLVVPFRGT